MLQKIIYHNWKSLKQATLYIDPLTVLIGSNASGKSNALEGLLFLQRLAQGSDLHTAFTGAPGVEALRGGFDWAAAYGETSFMLSVTVGETATSNTYEYTITVEVTPHVQIVAEELKHITPKKTTTLFTATADDTSLKARFRTKGRTMEHQLRRSHSALTQLALIGTYKALEHAIQCVQDTLQRVFLLDPVPATMRDYAQLSAHLYSNAANIAGVIAALPDGEQQLVEQQLSLYAKALSDGAMNKVWVEKVGKLQSDAMLYCQESWHDQIIDTRGLSAGSLHFLAIAAALLTCPKQSLLLIEDVDAGLHPARASVLINMLQTVGTERELDIVVTTHNPAVLNALSPHMLPFVMVTYRHTQTGWSQLAPLDSLESLPKLLSRGQLGDITAKGWLESAVKLELKSLNPMSL